jgi:hypothetical protein
MFHFRRNKRLVYKQISKEKNLNCDEGSTVLQARTVKDNNSSLVRAGGWFTGKLAKHSYFTLDLDVKKKNDKNSRCV